MAYKKGRRNSPCIQRTLKNVFTGTGNCYNLSFLCAFPIIPQHAVPLSAVRTMDIYDEQTTTMRVRWEQALGATGYMLLYSAINATQPTLEQEVRHIIAALRKQKGHTANQLWI